MKKKQRKSKKSGHQKKFTVSKPAVAVLPDFIIHAREIRRSRGIAMGMNRMTAVKRGPRVCGRQIISRQHYLNGEIPMRMRLQTGPDGKVHRHVTYGNLLRCGSLWVCPHCALLVAAHRRAEITNIVKTWMDKDYPVLFLTLTMRHSGHERLDDLWDAKQSAWEAVQKSGAWKTFKKSLGLTGFICATEITYRDPKIGGKGWHVHIHVLLFMTNAIEEKEDLDAMRTSLFKSWANNLAQMGMESPELDRDDGKPLGADLRRIKKGRIGDYFKKSAYLSSPEGVAFELSSGNTSKHGRGEQHKNRTPLQLLQGMIDREVQKGRGNGIWFDLPGRKNDPRCMVTYEGSDRFILHNPGKVGAVLEQEGLRQIFVEGETGEVWERDEVVMDELPMLGAYSAWFEFQTVVAGFRSSNDSRLTTKKSRQQITRSQRKSEAVLRRPLTEPESLWNRALDSVGDEVTDEGIVLQNRSGVDHALISNSHWIRVLATDDAAQIRLQEALEISDWEAKRVAADLGITLSFVDESTPLRAKPDKSDRQKRRVLDEIELARVTRTARTLKRS
ncbi:hypothetical protein E3O19_16140 [Cryobacterium algoritolerans]|uniref:Uncharacterized protein n=1 Tax=Cryobacterium algoritolerans TaxID=1259184 RepID=A0A4V3IDZ9_9MICO|nr:protein rep [Cryobacterium algoritolerans]TFC09872.1 hypothetical protein E3O19_16140 [Cryobacterium algoritolerans]